MDGITQTSLEALFLKATTSPNQHIDPAAVEAFCALVNKEKDGAHIGVKVLSSKLSSGNEKELMQTLNIIDTCMGRCGAHFHAEIGKFRFLNEMIKLVSPKYLGTYTPCCVKQKVLQLLYLWTLDYTKETKIKDAFEMLRKQGVVQEIPNPYYNSEVYVGTMKKRPVSTIFQDEQKSKILQKLLQSKNPEDIQTANWLIKSMVKEDDKRAEMKSRRISELESVQNNVRLLNEMLDSYKPNVTSVDELDLIYELHQSCERLKPNIMKIASETQQNEELLVSGNVLKTMDELNQVFNKYKHVILKRKTRKQNQSLLDFENIDNVGEKSSNCQNDESTKTEIDTIYDIFEAPVIPDSAEILQPTTITCDKSNVDDKEMKKLKALEELDVLGETLLKENLVSARHNEFMKSSEKIPMNLMASLTTNTNNEVDTTKEKTKNECLNFDLNYLLNKPLHKPNNYTETINKDQNGDDLLVDLDDDKIIETIQTTNDHQNHIPIVTKSSPEKSIKNLTDKLNDIVIKLDEIKPSSTPPLTVLNEKNGISVTLHLAKDKPRDNVHVFVITTLSKNEFELNNYLFQAVVPKGCKIKLQPPSKTGLPPYNPFLPPAAITQIMLIAKPEDVQNITLKFIISYVMDDETCTEMGEVEHLPITN